MNDDVYIVLTQEEWWFVLQMGQGAEGSKWHNLGARSGALQCRRVPTTGGCPRRGGGTALRGRVPTWQTA